MRQSAIRQLRVRTELWDARALHTEKLGTLWDADTASRMRDAYLEVLFDVTGIVWHMVDGKVKMK